MGKYVWSFKEGMLEGELEADSLAEAVREISQLLLDELDVMPEMEEGDNDDNVVQ